MDMETQPAPPHENGSKIEESTTEPVESRTATNGKGTNKASSKREKRSRSRTPQMKNKKPEDTPKKKTPDLGGEKVNGNGEKKTRTSEKRSKGSEELNGSNSKIALEQVEDDSAKNSAKEDTSKPKETIIIETVEPEPATLGPSVSATSSKTAGEVEMDPLILTSDEPDPELLFDENSDMDSGKGSPTQSRCKTRRSHTRNIPTPRTPKSLTDSESEKNSVAPTPTPENLNETTESLTNPEDVSMTAEAGSDTTRLNYIENNVSLLEEESGLSYNDERSFSETIRCLSARRTIRPIKSDSFGRFARKNRLNKSGFDPPSGDDVDTFRATLKRKRSATPEERKRYKTDTSGFVSYLSSPLVGLKNRFMSDGGGSSTPTLTGYKDGTKDIHEEADRARNVAEESEKKNWCVIM